MEKIEIQVGNNGRVLYLHPRNSKLIEELEIYLETVLLNSVAYNNPHMVTKEQVGLQVSKEEMEDFKQMCEDYIDEMKGIIDSFGQVLAKKF